MTGVFFSLFSAVLASSKDLVSKRLAFTVDGTTSAFASFLFSLPFYLVLLTVMVLMGSESLALTKTALFLVLLRSLTDTVAELSKMHAFQHADISLIASIYAINPLLLALISPAITGDALPIAGFIAVILVVVGTLLIVLRSAKLGGTNPKKGIALAMLSALCFALNSCFDRLAVQHASPTISAFSMTLLSAMFLYPFYRRVSAKGTVLRNHTRPFLVRGFFELAFMVSKLYALQFLQAPYVIGIQKISVVLSIIGGKIFFKEEDFTRRILAGVVLLIGIALIVWLSIP